MKNVVVFCVCVFLFLSCKSKDENAIKIGVMNGPTAMSFIKIIEDEPQFENKKIELIIKDEPQQIQALMMQNELDFAVLPTIMAANLYNKGVKYRMLACPVWGSLYILTNQKQILNIDDLNGQKIGVFGQGATADVLLQREITQKRLNGVIPDYTYTTNAALGLALSSGTVKIAVISEPLVSKLLLENKNIHIVSRLNCQEFLGKEDVDIFAQTAFLVRESLISEDEDIINFINDAYVQSCNMMNEDPALAAQLLVKHEFFKDTISARNSICLANIRYVSAFAVEREIERYLNVFYEFNPQSIGGRLPDKKFIYIKEF